jgi:hypothetical protein
MRTTHPSLLIEASNEEELRTSLSQIDTEVPARHQKRRSLHVERYDIVHLLAALRSESRTFPITVHHGDRPDFVLTEAGGRRIAIECVEAISPNVAKKAHLRGLGHGPEMHFIERAVPGEKLRSTKQLLREIYDERSGPPWHGDSAEREWAEAMAYFAKDKAEMVRKEGYDRGDETWLLVYDNWSIPSITARRAAEHFTTQPALGEILATFSRIFVMDGKGVWDFFADGWLYHPMQDPRKDSNHGISGSAAH